MIDNLVPHKKIRKHLFDLTDERVAFLVGHRQGAIIRVLDIWPTPNATRRDPRYAYAITKQAWRTARAKARALGLAIVGHAHSHPNGGIKPSHLDLRYIRPGEVGLVYHPAGWLVWYTKEGVVLVEREQGRTIGQRLIALLFSARGE